MNADYPSNSLVNPSLGGEEILYRLPNTKEIYRAKINTTDSYNISNEYFTVKPFSKLSPAQVFNIVDKQVFAELPYSQNNFLTLPDIWNNFPFKKHEEKVSIAQEKIKKGNFQKLVIASSYSVELPYRLNLLATFQEITNAYENAFCCIYPLEDNKWWLGATPELLLSFDSQKKQGTSMSLAGTQLADNQTPWGNKEVFEQEIVTEYIAAIAQKLNIPFSTSTDKELFAGHLKHLLTNFNFQELNYLKAQELLSALHPTPAVATDNLEEGLAIIQEIEAFNRKLYAGYWGIKNSSSDFQYYVNLRCVEIEQKPSSTVLTFYAGGGITAASKPEEEAQEALRKMKVIGSKLLFEAL